MMSDNPDVNNSSPWWENWMHVAKDKSLSVYNLVKQDLTEFSNVMQCDGSRMACAVKEKLNQDTAASASKKVKQGMTSLWGELSKALVIPPDDDDCYEVVKVVDGKPVAFDRAKAQLHALQKDTSTYTLDSSQSDERFQKWVKSSFDLEKVKVEISDLLVSNSDVRSIYTQLVPLTVSNVDFWRRYFYKKYLLEEDENRRIALVKRAQETSEDELGWDEEEDVPQKEQTSNKSLIEKEHVEIIDNKYNLQKELILDDSATEEEPWKDKFDICPTKKDTEDQTNSEELTNSTKVMSTTSEVEETSSTEPGSKAIPIKNSKNTKHIIDVLKLGTSINDTASAPIPTQGYATEKLENEANTSTSTSINGTNGSNAGSLTDDWEKVCDVNLEEKTSQGKTNVSNKESDNTSDDWEEW